MTTLLISDANVLIDLATGELLDRAFRLPEQLAVPDILFQEELAECHADLPGRGLRQLELTPESIEYAIQLRRRYRHASQNDLFALALAAQESCMLLTGDKRLREAAELEGREVRGTLWLIQRMLDDALLDLAGAERAYRLMRRQSRRLPWEKVARQLER